MTPAALAVLSIFFWGFIASLCMAAVTWASQHFGWSRLSLPFVLGTAFTADRRTANVLGFILFVIGGWIFAVIYYLIFAAMGRATLWIGAIIGAAHAMLLLTAVFPLLPSIHPRVASNYDGPASRRPLEPPGFMALHYGYRTPVAIFIAQATYGAILGAAVQL